MAREMKNSGVQWIGDIPDAWSISKIKHNFGIISGCGFSDRYQGETTGDYPFCKASDINGMDKTVSSAANFVSRDVALRERYNIIPVNSILFAKIGEALKKNHRKINTVECIVDNNCQALYQKEDNDIHYMYYLFRQIDMTWFDNAGTIPCVNNLALKNFFIPIPPLPEQKVIADFLDAKCGEIDGLLADLDAEVKTLTEYKKSLIAETVTRGLNPNAPMKSSGIPWAETIPAHWGVEPVYTHFHDKIFLNLDYEYQRAFKFKYGTLEYKNEVGDLAFYMPTYIKYSKVKKGDIIINGLNLNYDFISQRVAITPEDGIITSAYLAIRPFEGVIPSYFCYLFKAMDNMKLFHGMGKGIRLTLSFDELKRVRIPIPNKNEQIEIANYLDSKCAAIDQAITDKTQQIETLKAYKASLIYEYVTGKKQVAL